MAEVLSPPPSSTISVRGTSTLFEPYQQPLFEAHQQRRPSMAKALPSSPISVAVKCRPLTKGEQKQCMHIIQVMDDKVLTIVNATIYSLEDYNKQIEQLKQEMNDASHGTDNIRSDISALAQRYDEIDRDEECGIAKLQDDNRALDRLTKSKEAALSYPMCF
ncbi:hypothetical protein ZIOFF_018431 [Zingiber officinale]|uniref:Uncharacterized protein n=1 Tax=Zingiber officinale TaxID=94328 RepID=A0A8J5HWJ0_ZINOF|nr:hypothetical protein ZIOFF_018431 [Zingiber officinale]